MPVGNVMGGQGVPFCEVGEVMVRMETREGGGGRDATQWLVMTGVSGPAGVCAVPVQLRDTGGLDLLPSQRRRPARELPRRQVPTPVFYPSPSEPSTADNFSSYAGLGVRTSRKIQPLPASDPVQSFRDIFLFSESFLILILKVGRLVLASILLQDRTSRMHRHNSSHHFLTTLPEPPR
jgi:hypothetical protein